MVSHKTDTINRKTRFGTKRFVPVWSIFENWCINRDFFLSFYTNKPEKLPLNCVLKGDLAHHSTPIFLDCYYRRKGKKSRFIHQFQKIDKTVAIFVTWVFLPSIQSSISFETKSIIAFQTWASLKQKHKSVCCILKNETHHSLTYLDQSIINKQINLLYFIKLNLPLLHMLTPINNKKIN